uniref:Alphaactinin1 putative n=1 Tax=Albugo laibachii Nc14 TaxID=890382 RepID=F0WEA0_9STRA|nr:alphaactinin1 putative [Albugo laibachii Nc14]|eukprot:CCA19531.1 alphaactinin1 putative [Albugo laibachii Nc14]
MAHEEWVDVQKNTFTRWANTYLSRKRLEIEDLYVDLSDGTRLIALLQIICREKVCRKHNRKPRMRIQKMENLNQAFAFMHKKNMNLTNIGSTDILDGNQKLILGLLWILIKTFQVAEIDVEGVSGKDGLLLWVNRSLVDYPTIKVKNFSDSWANGMAFCALIHRFYPNLIEFDQLQAVNAIENVRLAFEIAENKFKIPQLLNLYDVAGIVKPDEKSIMTYVALLFKEFASGQQKRKAVVSIAKAVNIAQRHQELAKEYETLAPNLEKWLVSQNENFEKLLEESAAISNLQDVRQALAQLSDYKKNEKPSQEAAYVAVEGCAGRWLSSCRNNGRTLPILTPPIEQLQALKAKLEELETTYISNLQKYSETFQRTEIFLARVVTELEKIEAWSREIATTKAFEMDLNETSTSTEAEEKLESINFIKQVELPRYRLLLVEVLEQSSSLATDHAESVTVLVRIDAMKAFLESVDAKIEDIHADCVCKLKKQIELDGVVKDCKLLMRNLKYTIEGLDEEIGAVAKLKDTSKNGVETASRYFKDVLLPKIDSEIVTEYYKLKQKKQILEEAQRISDAQLIEKVHLRVEKLQERCTETRLFFERELAGAASRDELCHEFATLASSIKERCAKSTQAINNVVGTVAEQFTSMKDLMESLFPSPDSGLTVPPSVDGEIEPTTVADDAIQESVQPSSSLVHEMESLEKVNEQLEKLHVFTNPFTVETIHELRAQYNSVEAAVRDKVKSLEKELALCQLGNLTPQQLTEIKEVFDHFDIDCDRKLERDEFIMACKGLGLALSEEECHDAFDKMDEAGNEEITFSAFSEFGAEQLQSGSSMEDVKTAFEILTTQNLTTSKLEEHFEPNIVEFIRSHLDQLGNDGNTLDYEKFAAFMFEM